jgi:hypothetical protein
MGRWTSAGFDFGREFSQIELIIMIRMDVRIERIPLILTDFFEH